MSLTTLQVRNAKPGRHADGKGLYLLVKPSGARSWVLRLQAEGRRRDFGLGAVLNERKHSVDCVPLASRRELTLAEARDKAALGRTLFKGGVDPAIEWKRQTRVIPTFEEAARQYHESVKAGFRNARHRDSWLSSLVNYAFPLLGAKRVDAIDATAIREVLLSFWLVRPETARRVRQRIGAVLDFAHAQGWRSSEAPLRAASRGLPNQPKGREHFKAMPYADLPAFAADLRGRGGSVGRLALLYTILTAARSGEVRGATWGEIDRDERAWRIPGNRMKAGKPHLVPLSDAALAILDTIAGLFEGKPDDLVFPGAGGRPISDMTMAKVLKAAGRDCTVHGFRSSFRDWAAEQTSFPPDWAEAALAHVIPNKVEAAYRRTQFFDQRRKLMDAWADYVDARTKVVRLVG